MNWVQSLPPGADENAVGGLAGYSSDTDTIYHQGQLGKFARGHEMGHAFDDQVMSDGDRNKFMRIMGVTGPWYQGTGIKIGSTRAPSEYFADWYGNAAAGNDPSRSWDDAYSPAPTPRQFRQFRMALARLGRRQQLSAYTPK